MQPHCPTILHPAVGADETVWVHQVLSSVQCGFPSPAADSSSQRIDLLRQLLPRPASTFLMRAQGSSMREAGIDDGDVLIVDRSLQATHGCIVVAVLDSNDFCVKRLWKRGTTIRLQAANPTYPDIIPREGQTIEIFGVVTHAIKTFRG